MDRRRIFLILHLLLVALAIAASAVLITSRGGHPPAIILLPVVLVAWIAGHTFLWFIHWTLRRQPALQTGARLGGWPLPILLLFVASGVALFVQVNGLGWTLGLSGESLSLRRASSLILVVGTTAILFFGVLYRRPWTRYVLAAIPALFCVMILIRVGFAFSDGPARSPSDWLVAASYVAVSGGLCAYLLRSKAAADFFEDSSR